MVTKSSDAGINEIFLSTPHMRISAEQLAEGVMAKNVIQKLSKFLSEEINSLEEKIREMEEIIVLSYPYPYGPIEEYIAPRYGHKYTIEELKVEADRFKGILKKLDNSKSVEEATASIKPLVDDEIIKQQEIDSILNEFFVDPKKISEGLGIYSIILPSFAESNATFVADNLYGFITNIANDKEKLSKFLSEPVKTIYYSSESNPDRSRPELEIALELVYSRLIEENEKKYMPIISILRNAMLFPTTYACVGGVMSIDQAMRSIGDKESVLVVSADNAVYDPKLAPSAEFTQGAGAVLFWITNEPSIAKIHYEGRGAYHLSLADFTKYLQEHPVVYGKFSEIIYVYMVSKALANSSVVSMPLNGLDFFINHVPFPKQALYLATPLFVHEIRNNDKVLYNNVVRKPEVGPEPLNGYSSFTEMLDAKFRAFNRDLPIKNEQEFIKYIENDADIKKYWAWLKAVRLQPEFKAFIEKLKIKEALVLPSQTGNVYSSASLQSLTSLLVELAKDSSNEGAETAIKLKGVFAGYGSGAQAIATPITIDTTKDKLVNNISLNINTIDIGAEQYIALHKWLIDGPESVRSSTSGNLIEKTKALLRSDTLPDGFYVIKRNIDGTGEFAYVEKGIAKNLTIRY